VVISDVRFPNEINFIRSVGGTVVRVKRGEDPIWYDDAMSTNTVGINIMDQYNVHESEWAWIGQKVDYTLVNDSTLEKLKDNVKFTLTQLPKDNTIFHHQV
jgi:hypothetical protein